MILKYSTLILALAGSGLAGTLVLKRSQAEPPPLRPPVEPAESAFPVFVAAAGLTEASTHNISIGTTFSGIVKKMHVTVGSSVNKGDSLFEIDDRSVRARLSMQQAALKTAEARVRTAMATLDDARQQLDFLDRSPDKRAFSGELLASRRAAAAICEAKFEEANSDVVAAKAQIRAIEIELEQMTIHAPVDGLVLQVNTREGEFASTGVLSNPLILMGNIEELHVRVDVDEDNAWRVREGAPAIAHLRGNKNMSTELKFVRFEPYIVPKQSLTGSVAERVDTRVLQVIYRFKHANLPTFVGQQMEVFIDASPLTSTASSGG